MKIIFLLTFLLCLTFLGCSNSKVDAEVDTFINDLSKKGEAQLARMERVCVVSANPYPPEDGDPVDIGIEVRKLTAILTEMKQKWDNIKKSKDFQMSDVNTKKMQTVVSELNKKNQSLCEAITQGGACGARDLDLLLDCPKNAKLLGEFK